MPETPKTPTSNQGWIVLDPPEPLEKHLVVGRRVKVQHVVGLASAPKTEEEILLVGDINNVAGLCGCCSMYQPVVLAYQQGCMHQEKPADED